MPSLPPFVSKNDLAAHLGQELVTDRAVIAVDSACDICRTIAEQTFNEVTDEDIVLDGPGTDALLLPEFPVIDVSEVTEDDEALVADDDYKLNGNGILLRMPSVSENGWSNSWIRRSWRCGRQNIAVTYSHGYAPDDLPRDVRIVALSIAARLYSQSSGVVFEQLGDYSVRYDGAATDLTKTDLAILRKYKRAK